MKKKELIAALIFFTCLGLLFYLSYSSQKDKNNLIDKNKTLTIAKIYEIKSGRTFTSAEYYFYYKNKKYFSNSYIDNENESPLNKYYEIEFSSINPKFSRIFLNEEIIEKSKIIYAGFKY